MTEINVDEIFYLNEPTIVVCDRQCGKAWGVNSRPRILLDPTDPDDYVFLSDGEMGTAPVDPGTYEGACGKPLSPDSFPNKWCVRECERSVLSNGEQVKLPDFSKRYYNMPWRHT